MANLSKNDFMMSLQDLSAFLKTPSSDLLNEIGRMGKSPKGFVDPKVVRKILSEKGFKYPFSIFSFQMLKGGVAKTTSALNFGLRAAQYGARVLFVDLDQQANLSFALGIQDEAVPVWVDIVEKKVSIKEAIVSVDDGIDLIPSSLNNSVIDRVLLNSQRNWSQAVVGPLKEVRAHYDLVIIDTAPHLSVVNSAVTCASDIIVMPINPDKFSLLGLEKHLSDLSDLKNEFNLKFETKILFTKFDGREKFSHELFEKCQQNYSEVLLKSYIRTSTEVKNSVLSGKTLFSTKSPAKADYDAVTRELLHFSN